MCVRLKKKKLLFVFLVAAGPPLPFGHHTHLPSSYCSLSAYCLLDIILKASHELTPFICG